MPIIIRLAVALELICMAIEYAYPASRVLLPIGGSHIVQFGIFMAVAIAVTELMARKSQ